MGKIRFMQGNEAMTEGAIAAGARFYAGYPITPSTEVAETSAIRLPQVGGVYIQMEDEIGSIAALIGAACAGKKAYTATSGPGLSLMAENLGVAVLGEVPCVIIDVQRSGPSTGMATRPAQGDVMQARWGTHGDHAMIALAPSSVQDCYDLMRTAFAYAQRYRTPVIFLADEIIGHLRERCVIPDPEEIPPAEQPDAIGNLQEYRPYDHTNGLVPLAAYGSKHIFKINGSMHDQMGRPCADPQNADQVIRHLSEKIEGAKDEITLTRAYRMEDASYVLIAYGGTARSALSAMELARAEGIPVGVLQLVTVWPVAEKEIDAALAQAKAVVVPELNLGQFIGEVRMRNRRNIPVVGVNRVDGKPIEPAEILEKLREVMA